MSKKKKEAKAASEYEDSSEEQEESELERIDLEKHGPENKALEEFNPCYGSLFFHGSIIHAHLVHTASRTIRIRRAAYLPSKK